MPKPPSSTDKLGYHFMDEVRAAGLADPPISIYYDTGEIFGRENLSDADNARLDGVIAAHNPQLWLERQNKAQAQRKSHADDARMQNLETKLQTMAPSEIDAWLDGTSSEELKAIVAQVLKLLAARLGEPGRIVPMK
jgi:hypothetical protein